MAGVRAMRAGAVLARRSILWVSVVLWPTLSMAATTWTFVDAYQPDWPVTVGCPDGSTPSIDSATPAVQCQIDGASTVSFTSGGSLACTAAFDQDGGFLPATSTCQPDATVSNTLTFSATQGVRPPADPATVLAIAFGGGGLTVACASGACGTVSDSQVLLPAAMASNGAMTLAVSTGTGSSQVSCQVAFVDNFIDDRNTTCQNVALVATTGGPAAQQLTFPSQTVGTVTEGVLLVYPEVAPSATGTRVGTRSLTFVNQCSAPVWFSLVSGTVGSPIGGASSTTAGATPCADGTPQGNQTCPAGTTCRYVSASEAFCFYDPADPAAPSDGNALDQFMLAGHSKGGVPASQSISIPIYQENAVIFSGGASARIGCQNAAGEYVACTAGNCNASNSALGCGYTSGTDNGATIAEFTLQAKAMDFYDISIINGAHVPMMMAPSSGQDPISQPSSVIGYYWCGEPGATAPATGGQPVCDWNLASHLAAATAIPSDRKNHYVAVTAPPVSAPIEVDALNYCTRDSDCSSGEVCGLSLGLLALLPDSSRASLFTATGSNGASGPYTCGTAIGYNTPVDICALLTSGSDGFLDCNTALSQTSPAPGGAAVALSYGNLYACNGPTDNCVKAASDYAGTVCCGCTTWAEGDPIAVAGVVSGMSTACTFNGSGTNSNPAWLGQSAGTPPVVTAPDVLGRIGFLKQGCPTAYAYQFDDATSTFNCQVDGTGSTAGYNTTDYTLTFCPGGVEVQ